MNRKNSFLLFISACVPGCGQMYQGYMKRGVSMTLAFCGLIALSAFLYIGELAILLPVLWLFAFFDTYNIRNQAPERAAQNPDAYLFGLSGLDRENLNLLISMRHSFIGWTLVIVGLYGLWQIVIRFLSNIIEDIFGLDLYWIIGYRLPQIIILLLLIGLGLWFIRGPKKKPVEEFTGYTPPQDPVQAAPTGGEPTYQPVADEISRIIRDGAAQGPSEEERRHDGE